MRYIPVILLLGLMSAALSGKDRAEGSKAAAAFERFKQLEGAWEAPGPDGQTLRATYKVIAAGSCVQETFVIGDDEANAMVTMYHLDGDRLLLTHYCMAKNQPRMQAAKISDDLSEIVFTFLDGTNLDPATDGHMHKAVFHFGDDPNTFRSTWTFRQEGRETFTEDTTYRRVR